MKKRVVIPRTPDGLLTLSADIKEKHLADGEKSVLTQLPWPDITLLIDDVTSYHERALELKRLMREFYQKRDARVDELARFVRSSRDILTGFHSKEMKIMGQWGFDVREVRSSKKETKPEPPTASQS